MTNTIKKSVHDVEHFAETRRAFEIQSATNHISNKSKSKVHTPVYSS